MSGDAGDPLAGLSLKERELLQYLEDLQRNNPAEYDMIAKQIQEGGANLGEVLGDGSKAKKKPPAPKGEMVTPEPGFVAKTHSFTHQARKTFVNLCKSDHVDPPAQVEVPGGKLRRPVPAQVVSSVFRFRIPTPTLTLTFTLAPRRGARRVPDAHPTEPGPAARGPGQGRRGVLRVRRRLPLRDPRDGAQR
jgi:hypothetical protein